MYRTILVWGILILFCGNCFAQRRSFRGNTTDVLSVGAGLGIDHGGIGATLLYYPIENVGFFGSGGYAIVGFGYNAGMKIRMTNSETVHPFVSAMYGNNAVVSVTTDSKNKLFTGATLGGGVDIHFRSSNSYFSLALLVPIKSTEVDEYVNSLGGHGVSFNSTSMPVSISIGYRFTILDNAY